MPRPNLLVSVHDIAPASADATRRWLADLDARDVPATLLVIPGPWRGARLSQSPDLVAELHAARARGHELALHGWAHRAGPGGAPWRRAAAQLIARGAAEFAALDRAEATSRLAAGLAELAALDIEPVGFHPPGWLASPGAYQALRRVGLRYSSSHLFVHDLITERRHTLPALSHRPGGRGEAFGATFMRRSAAAMARSGRSFRVALHPDDLDHPGLRETTLAVIDDTLAAGYRAGTYSGLVMRGAAVAAR
ncbi:hypothetical protein GCM10009839_67350 [Catenulispora yoronensis]|uniref:Deacetylase n=1 Tax=Catenulispora yoronensis TaxID=450799 RepID=A0ABN2V598_9ACTN